VPGEVTADATPPDAVRGRLWLRARQGFVGAVGRVVLPAVGAGLVLRYLVPQVGSGLPGVVAVLGHRYPLLFGVALFLLFSALVHYWAPPASPAAVTRMLATGAAPPTRSRRGEVLGLVASVLAATAAALAIRAWARPYRVLSASMLPTFEPDDLIAGRLRGASAASRVPLRGDVVVFRSAAVAPRTGANGWPEMLVKRVVGLPGDRIEMRGEAPVINGWPVPWCDAGEYLHVISDTSGRALHGRLRVEFLDGRAYLTVHAVGPPFSGPYLVKPGEVFVLGDNRGNSMDSRAYHAGQGGGVSLDAIVARADRFLIGWQRTGDIDWGRVLRPIDSLRAGVRLDGAPAQPLDEGVARCLRDRPLETRPPPPVGGTP
jgi:signal peptidase I